VLWIVILATYKASELINWRPQKNDELELVADQHEKFSIKGKISHQGL
jgi:hypothetical protein